MSAVPKAWRERVRPLVAQWQASPLLRLGSFGIVVLLWVYALLAASDATTAWGREAEALDEQARTLRPLKDSKRWQQRNEDLASVAQRGSSLLWVGASRGEVEAKAQDALRTLAAKTGHASVRDLRLLSELKAEPAASTAAGPQRVRLRLLLDFQRASAMALLAELAQAEPAFVVDRLLLQPQGATPVMELELHIAVRLQGDKP